MKDRIRELMEAQHMNQQTFANFIGINGASLSSIFNGRTKPTMNTVEAIKNKFPNVSTDWLIFGKGGMFQTANDDTSQNDNVALNTSTAPQQTNLFESPQPTNGIDSTKNSTQQMAEADGKPQNCHTGNTDIYSANMAQSNNYYNATTHQGTTKRNLQQPQSAPAPMQIYVDKQPQRAPRRVTEIRVFYDDQTWEAFVPKK